MESATLPDWTSRVSCARHCCTVMMTNDDVRFGTVFEDISYDCLCRLLNLMTITSHDTYVKLIVSSLDYCRDGMSRLILSKGLTAASEVSQVIIVLSLISQYLALNLIEETKTTVVSLIFGNVIFNGAYFHQFCIYLAAVMSALCYH